MPDCSLNTLNNKSFLQQNNNKLTQIHVILILAPVHWILCFLYTLITLTTVIPCTCITATHILLHWISIISCSSTTDILATITACSWTLLFHVLYHCYRVTVLTCISTSGHYYSIFLDTLISYVVSLLHGQSSYMY